MESGGRDPLHPPISGEEEALKRNTDCVYFLASPLTCKKVNLALSRFSLPLFGVYVFSRDQRFLSLFFFMIDFFF